MDEAMLLTLAVAVVVLVLSGATTVVLVRGRRRLERELSASRSDVDALRRQVESLSRPVEPDHEPARLRREFVITSLPDGPSSEVAAPDEQQGGAGRFASVAVEESLVRLISLAYGVGRALSPENRNRIRFAMRQEVKRARRQRRRDLREARRHLRTQQPGGERADLRPDAA